MKTWAHPQFGLKVTSGLWISFLILVLIQLLMMKADGSSSPIRASYGEPCNKTIKCKSQSWLSCDSSETKTCLCAKPEEMMFDPLKDKCVALVGERCKYGFDEDERNLWYEKAECVKNAVCGPSGLCSCPKGFYENPELLQCSPVKSFGALCNPILANECNKDKFLSCFEGICTCDPDNAIYNKDSFTGSYKGTYFNGRNYIERDTNDVSVPGGICIGRVGSSCAKSVGKYCVRNSYCDESSSGTCLCKASYTMTSDKLCGLGYNQACSESTVCSDRLRCHGTFDIIGIAMSTQKVRCQCPQPKYQVYNSTSGTCMGKVGSPCDPTDPKTCIDKTVCMERNNLFQCECEQDFVETLDGKCEIGYGNPCKYSDGVGSGSGIKIDSSNICDQVAGLECIGFKCGCENEVDVYESERRRCSLAIGMRCKERADCVTNSECVKNSNPKLPGRCTCLDEFEVARNGSCVGVGVVVASKEESDEIDEENLLKQKLEAGNNTTWSFTFDPSTLAKDSFISYANNTSEGFMKEEADG